MFCSQCGTENDNSNEFCAGCGRKLYPDKPAKNFCGQCGTENEPGAAFCGECGAPLSGGNPFSMSEEVFQSASSAPAGGVFAKIMNLKVGKVPIIPVVAAAVVVCAVILLAGNPRSMFMKPAKYYSYVEKKYLEKQVDRIGAVYGQATSMSMVSDEHDHANWEIKVTPGESVQTLLSMVPDEVGDLSNLSSVELGMYTSRSGDQESMRVKLAANEEDILSCNMVANVADEELYMQIPEISESYLDLSSAYELDSEDLGGYYGRQILPYSNVDVDYEALFETIPAADEVADMCRTYTRLVSGSFADVERDRRGTLKAEGVSQKCTVLTVSVSEKEMRELIEKAVEEMNEDDSLRELYSVVDSDISFDSVVGQLEDALDYMEFDKAVMTLYVDKKDEVIGREFEIGADGTDISFGYAFPKSGGKFGYEMTARVDGEKVFSLTGDGKEKSDRITGSFVCTGNSMDGYVDVDVENFDLNSFDKGYINGTITLNTDIREEISNYYLKLDVDSDADACKMAGTMMLGDSDLLGVELAFTTDAKADKISVKGQPIPIDDESGVYEYLMTADFDSISDTLYSLLGTDFGLSDILNYGLSGI